jgi:hypothetical protein
MLTGRCPMRRGRFPMKSRGFQPDNGEGVSGTVRFLRTCVSKHVDFAITEVILRPMGRLVVWSTRTCPPFMSPPANGTHCRLNRRPRLSALSAPLSGSADLPTSAAPNGGAPPAHRSSLTEPCSSDIRSRGPILPRAPSRPGPSPGAGRERRFRCHRESGPEPVLQVL